MRVVSEALAFHRQPLVPARLAAGAALGGAVAAALFSAFPWIDVTVTRMFYAGGGRFVGNQLIVFEIARDLIGGAVIVCGVLTLIAIAMSRTRSRPFLGVGIEKWWFIALCLVTGPILIANVGFKDHWGRARPRDIVEFGGQKQFTPPLQPADQCRKNCSFVSGETSGVLALFFAAAVVFPGSAAMLLSSGLLWGALTGLIRIAQGGHFLSDVIFSCVLMALTVAGLRFAFILIAQERGPFAGVTIVPTHP